MVVCHWIATGSSSVLCSNVPHLFETLMSRIYAMNGFCSCEWTSVMRSQHCRLKSLCSKHSPLSAARRPWSAFNLPQDSSSSPLSWLCCSGIYKHWMTRSALTRGMQGYKLSYTHTQNMEFLALTMQYQPPLLSPPQKKKICLQAIHNLTYLQHSKNKHLFRFHRWFVLVSIHIFTLFRTKACSWKRSMFFWLK